MLSSTSTPATGVRPFRFRAVVVSLVLAAFALTGLSAAPAAAAQGSGSESMVSGQISAPVGSSLAESELTVHLTDSRGSKWNGVVASDGTFLAPRVNLAGTTFTLTVSDINGWFETYVSAPFELEVGESIRGLEISLTAAATLRGKLTSPGGAQLAVPEGRRHYLNAVVTDSRGWRANGSVAADGTFRIGLGSLQGTTFTLTTYDYAGWFEPYAGDQFEVARGESVGGLEIPLATAGTIGGRVDIPEYLLAEMQPGDSYFVRVTDSNGATRIGDVTLPDGDFLIGLGGLTGPTFKVLAYDEMGKLKDSATKTIEIVEGGSVSGIELSMTAGLTISGRITGPAGAPLTETQRESLSVLVYDEDNNTTFAAVAADGTYRAAIGNVPGPRYFLEVVTHEAIFYPYRSGPFELPYGKSRTGFNISLSLLLGTPTVQTVSAGDGHVNLRWSEATSSEGMPVTDYQIRYSANGGLSWTQFAHAASTETQATIGGLANGTSYVFQVAAVNIAGVGVYSATSAAVTPGAAATPPADSYQTTVDQKVVGSVPRKIKSDGVRKPTAVSLPKSTNSGAGVRWKAASPRVCKVVRGKLAFTGMKGRCKIVGTAPASTTRAALNKKFTVKVA